MLVLLLWRCCISFDDIFLFHEFGGFTHLMYMLNNLLMFLVVLLYITYFECILYDIRETLFLYILSLPVDMIAVEHRQWYIAGGCPNTIAHVRINNKANIKILARSKAVKR